MISRIEVLISHWSEPYAHEDTSKVGPSGMRLSPAAGNLESCYSASNCSRSSSRAVSNTSLILRQLAETEHHTAGQKSSQVQYQTRRRLFDLITFSIPATRSFLTCEILNQQILERLLPQNHILESLRSLRSPFCSLGSA